MTDTLRAALWISGSIASFTAMAVAGREVSLDLDVFEIMMYRSLVGLVIVFTIAGLAGTLHQAKTRRLPLHFLRNLTHFTGQNLWFYAVATIPLAQVFALEFTTPIWAMLVAVPLLGEALTKRGVTAALIGFSGVLLVAQPWAAPPSPGLITAALAAIGFGCTAVFTRRLTRTETITCILVYLTVIQAIMGIIAAGYDGDIALPAAPSVPWIILIGCAGILAHFCLTRALSLAPAALVMPIDFLRLPIIVFIGATWYDEELGRWLAIGAALILFANALNLGALARLRAVLKR